MKKLAQALRVGVHAQLPIPFHCIDVYHHVQSCSVRSSWEGRYTPPYFYCTPISTLGWCKLFFNYRCCDLSCVNFLLRDLARKGPTFLLKKYKLWFKSPNKVPVTAVFLRTPGIDSLRESIPSWNWFSGGSTQEQCRFQLKKSAFLGDVQVLSILGSYSIPGMGFSSRNTS